MPSRPEAERLRAERPRPPYTYAGGLGAGRDWGGLGSGGAGVEEGGIGGMAGGHMHFQAGLGFFPSLFGLQFVSAKMCLCNGVG